MKSVAFLGRNLQHILCIEQQARHNPDNTLCNLLRNYQNPDLNNSYWGSDNSLRNANLCPSHPKQGVFSLRNLS
jgi:hypothetical protein